MKEALWFIGILIVLSLAVQIITGKNVLASDWKTTQPSVVSRAEVLDSAPQDMFTCGGQELTINVLGWGSIDRACVYGNSGSVRMARLGLSYAVAFPFSEQFYELRGACVSAKCAYSSGSDSLLAQSHLGSYRLGVDLYKNFSKALKRHFDFSTMQTYFQFEPTNAADYSLKIGEISLEGESVAFSPNGRYAIIEARSYGFFRLDINTLEVRRVIAPGSTYGLLNDPHHDLAISNDGTKVALTGYRSQTSVHLIDSHCGDIPIVDLPRYFPSTVTACGAIHLDDVLSTPGFYHSFQPRFNDSGSRLGVSAYKRDNTVERVIYGSTGGSSSVQYIALGDSFTSGEGEVSDHYYKETSVGGERCHVSVRSYPYLIAQHWNVEARSVACSGARTVDITSQDDRYSGQSGILQGLSASQVSQFKEAALGHFRSGIVPQSHFISEYQPSFSSIGIGGNDAGLMGKLSACLNLDTCEWAKNSEKRLDTAKEILSVYSKVRETITNIQSLSPETEVTTIGYPRIINTSSNASCGVVLGALLNTEERVFIDESIKLLNLVMKSAAYAEGVGYIDIENAFKANKLCDVTNKPAMNTIRIGDDIAPISFLKDFRLIGAESFHPTYRGHEYIAKAIADNKPTADSLGNCGECLPNTPPSPSEYWGSDGDDKGEGNEDRRTRQVYQQVSSEIEYSPGDDLLINTTKGIFQPDTRVSIEIHSDVIHLGERSVEADGSVSATVKIPVNTPGGYHTVHLLGEAQDGNRVDVYYVIAIVDKNATELSTTLSGGQTGSNKSVLTIMNYDKQDARISKTEASVLGVLGLGDVSNNYVAQNDYRNKPPKNIEVRGGVSGILIWLGSGLVLSLAGGIVGAIWSFRAKRRQISHEPGG